MNDFVFSLIRNAIIMSLLTLLYSIVIKIQFKSFVVKWRYYSWIVIVLGLIVPWKPKVSIYLQASSFLSRIFKVQQSIPTGDLPILEPADKLPVPYLYIFLIVIWGLGVILFWCHLIFKHKKFLKFIIRWSEDIDDAMIIGILQDLQQRLRISQTPKVVKCAYINSPLMLGFIKPLIIIPNKNYDMDEIAYILHHELVHFKRKDLWYKALTFLAVSLYWFNPVVYFMAEEIAILCEISCDEEVLKDADYTQRQRYSNYLVNVMKSQLNVQSVFATSFCGDKYNMKRRILSALSMKKRRQEYFSSILLVIGIMATGITFSIKTEALEISQNNFAYQNEIKSDSSDDVEEDKTFSSTQDELSFEEVLQNKGIQIEKITSDFILVKKNTHKYTLIEQSDGFMETKQQENVN